MRQSGLVSSASPSTSAVPSSSTFAFAQSRHRLLNTSLAQSDFIISPLAMEHELHNAAHLFVSGMPVNDQSMQVRIPLTQYQHCLFNTARNQQIACPRWRRRSCLMLPSVHILHATGQPCGADTSVNYSRALCRHRGKGISGAPRATRHVLRMYLTRL